MLASGWVVSLEVKKINLQKFLLLLCKHLGFLRGPCGFCIKGSEHRKHFLVQ